MKILTDKTYENMLPNRGPPIIGYPAAMGGTLGLKLGGGAGAGTG